MRGFQLGSDDCLTKPFHPMELVMRVKALLKRYRIAASQLINSPLGAKNRGSPTLEFDFAGWENEFAGVPSCFGIDTGPIEQANTIAARSAAHNPVIAIRKR